MTKGDKMVAPIVSPDRLVIADVNTLKMTGVEGEPPKEAKVGEEWAAAAADLGRDKLMMAATEGIGDSRTHSMKDLMAIPEETS